MKLEVGMYVRTNDGIFKIYAIAPKEEGYYKLILEQNGCLSIGDSEFIIKAKHKIKDLLEVGDYVNGERVTPIMLKIYKEQGVFGVPDKYDMFINEIYIKTIFTHEQFENNCFRIGDE